MFWRPKSYESLPALSVRGHELRASMRTVTLAWMFGTVWMVIVGGVAMLNFGYLAGFNEVHWGLLSALAFVATLAQLPASYLIERTGLRKVQFLRTGVPARLTWILVGLLALVLLVTGDSHAGQMAVAWAAMLVVLAAYLLEHLAAPAWNTWMADLVPPRIRGRFFAQRRTYAVCVELATAVGLGLLLDWSLPAGPRELLRDQLIGAREVPRLVWTLAAVFVLAGLFGATDILAFRRVREILRKAPPRRMSFRQIVGEPLRDRRFVHLAGASATLTFGVVLALPFFGLNCQKHLGMSNLQTMIVIAAVGPLGALASSRMWGVAVDRWGRRPILVIATVGVAASAWGWLLVPASAWWLGGFWTFFGGAVWAGLFSARFNMELSLYDKGGRSTYAASMNLFVALAGAAGGAAGGVLARMTAGWHWQLGPFDYVNYHLTFLVSGAIRALSILWLIGMPDPGAHPVPRVARQMVAGLYQGVPMLFSWPARLLRQGRSSRYDSFGRRSDRGGAGSTPLDPPPPQA